MTKLSPHNEKLLRGILSNYMVSKASRDSLEKILGVYLSLKEETGREKSKPFWVGNSITIPNSVVFNMEAPN